MNKDLFHWSDCAIYSEPAYPAGECNCGYKEKLKRRKENCNFCPTCCFGKIKMEKPFLSAGAAQCRNCSANYDLLFVKRRDTK